jgi:hypothetical protein
MLHRFGNRFGQKGSTRYTGTFCVSSDFAAALAWKCPCIVAASPTKQIAEAATKDPMFLFVFIGFSSLPIR